MAFCCVSFLHDLPAVPSTRSLSAKMQVRFSWLFQAHSTDNPGMTCKLSPSRKSSSYKSATGRCKRACLEALTRSAKAMGSPLYAGKRMSGLYRSAVICSSLGAFLGLLPFIDFERMWWQCRHENHAFYLYSKHISASCNMLSPAAWRQKLPKNVYFSCRWSWGMGRKKKQKCHSKQHFLKTSNVSVPRKPGFLLRSFESWKWLNGRKRLCLRHVLHSYLTKHCKDMCKYFKFSNIKECPETRVNSRALLTF